VRAEAEVLAGIRDVLTPGHDRTTAFRRVAEILRDAGGYRWAGLYEVGAAEIAIVAWAGAGEPKFPRFAVSEGLCGDAARSRATVVVGDVAADPRYLEAFETTRSEIVVPVLDAVSGQARALIDVESDRPNAFGEADRVLLERCAAEIAAAISPSPG